MSKDFKGHKKVSVLSNDLTLMKMAALDQKCHNKTNDQSNKDLKAFHSYIQNIIHITKSKAFHSLIKKNILLLANCCGIKRGIKHFGCYWNFVVDYFPIRSHPEVSFNPSVYLFSIPLSQGTRDTRLGTPWTG